MARAGSQRVIQMNDDSIAFYKYCITERPTAGDLEDMVDVFAEATQTRSPCPLPLAGDLRQQSG